MIKSSHPHNHSSPKELKLQKGSNFAPKESSNLQSETDRENPQFHKLGLDTNWIQQDYPDGKELTHNPQNVERKRSLQETLEDDGAERKEANRWLIFSGDKELESSDVFLPPIIW